MPRNRCETSPLFTPEQPFKFNKVPGSRVNIEIKSGAGATHTFVLPPTLVAPAPDIFKYPRCTSFGPKQVPTQVQVRSQVGTESGPLLIGPVSAADTPLIRS